LPPKYGSMIPTRNIGLMCSGMYIKAQTLCGKI